MIVPTTMPHLSSKNMTDDQARSLMHELQNTFSYDPSSGELRRKNQKGRTPAVNGRRSRYVDFCGRNRVTVSQIAYALGFNQLPTPPKIYFQNGNRFDLRLTNLHWTKPATATKKKQDDHHEKKVENV